MKTGKIAEANEHADLARSFAKSDSEYNQACFEALCGNDKDALDLLDAHSGEFGHRFRLIAASGG